MNHYSSYKKEKKLIVDELQETLNELKKTRVLRAFRAKTEELKSLNKRHNILI